HLRGDELLTLIARRLIASLRPGDTVARLGGDEFAVLIEDVPTTGDACKVAERIVDGLRDPFVLGGQEGFSGASIGIAHGNAGYEGPRTPCATRTPRSTAPRRRAAAGGSNSTPACTTARSSCCSWRPTCGARWSARSCGCTTSRWSRCRTARSPAPKRSCAGGT